MRIKVKRSRESSPTYFPLLWKATGNEMCGGGALQKMGTLATALVLVVERSFLKV